MFGSECIPCIFNQALKTYRVIGYSDEIIIEKLWSIMKLVNKLDYKLTAPEIYFTVYKWIREDSGLNDPYYKIKMMWNRWVLDKASTIKKMITESKDPIFTGLKISLAGNIIDYGALDDIKFEDTLNQVLSSKLTIDDYQVFRSKLDYAKSILFVLDNAGEAVLDKIFIESILNETRISKVYIGVREEPFINDVTIEDIRYLGFDELGDIEIIGFPVDINKHFTYLNEGRYSQVFRLADTTVLKGQGNYELFHNFKDIFFALIAKCKPVASHLNVDVGSQVFKFNR